MQGLQEIFIDWTAEHHRCTGCGDIIFYLTRDFTMVMSDEQLADFDAERLPPNFNKDTLPDGECPDCKAEREADIPIDSIEDAKTWLGKGNIIAELHKDGIMSDAEFIEHVNFLRQQVHADRKKIRKIVDDIPF